MARAAARALGYYSGPDSEPSTIQVRVGGAKGVLTVWPWMVRYQYSLRQSMEKFRSQDQGVNVIRVSGRGGIFDLLSLNCLTFTGLAFFVRIPQSTVHRIVERTGRS